MVNHVINKWHSQKNRTVRIAHLLKSGGLCCGVLLCLTIPKLSWALVVSADRQSLPLNETLRLELRSNDSNGFDSINTQAISEHFTIVNRSSQSEYSMVNGRTESVQKLVLTLAPKAVGTFTIPPITQRKRNSAPITITISEPVAPPDRLDDQSMVVQAETDKATAYVDEQVLYTFRVIYRVGLNNAEITPLEIPNTDITELEDATYQRSIGGQTYQVVEKRYAVFFKEAGAINIDPQVLTAVIGANRSRFGFGFGANSLAGGQQIKLGADPINVVVKDIPAAMQGKSWLPAENLTITERWDDSNRNAVVGQPLTRSIEVFAEGLAGAQLPQPNSAPIDGLNIYPEKPAFISQPWQGGVAGKRVDTFALIPTRPGNFTLPPISLTWWDTNSGQEQTASLPSKTFYVTDAPNSAQENTNTLPASKQRAEALVPPGASSQNNVSRSDSENTIESTGSERQTPFWRNIAILAMLAWLVTVIAGALWIRHNRATANSSANQRAHPDKNQNNSTACLRSLQQACADNNAMAAKQALSLWLKTYAHEKSQQIKQQAQQSSAGRSASSIGRVSTNKPSPDYAFTQAHNSEAIMALIGSAALIQASEDLNAWLYSAPSDTEEPSSWRGELLDDAIRNLPSVATDAKDMLPPLYPDGRSIP